MFAGRALAGGNGCMPGYDGMIVPRWRGIDGHRCLRDEDAAGHPHAAGSRKVLIRVFIVILMIVSGASLLMAGVVSGGQCRDAGRSVAEHDLQAERATTTDIEHETGCDQRAQEDRDGKRRQQPGTTPNFSGFPHT